MRNAGEKLEAGVAWQKYPDISLSDIYLSREFFLFPPIVRERERAPVRCEVNVRETVAGEKPAVAQPCVHFSSVHTVQETSPAFRSSAEMLAVAGTTMVQ